MQFLLISFSQKHKRKLEIAWLSLKCRMTLSLNPVSLLFLRHSVSFLKVTEIKNCFYSRQSNRMNDKIYCLFFVVVLLTGIFCPSKCFFPNGVGRRRSVQKVSNYLQLKKTKGKTGQELEKQNSMIIIVEILTVSQTCRVLLSTIFLSGLDVHFKGD